MTTLSELDVGTVPFDDSMAAATAALWPLTRHRGLFLADRACHAVAATVSGIAVTADTAWRGLTLPGIDIHVITR